MNQPADVPACEVEFSSLIAKYQAGVWRYLRALGADSHFAEDLTQATFIKLYQSGFKHETWPKTWSYLRRIAFNLFVDEYRKRGKREIVIAIEDRDHEWTMFHGDDDRSEEMLTALRECVKSLTGRAQQAIELRYGQMKSREEIADVLGMSKDGAKNLLQRAKDRLRLCVKSKIND